MGTDEFLLALVLPELVWGPLGLEPVFEPFGFETGDESWAPSEGDDASAVGYCVGETKPGRESKLSVR
jgi:hypothetical protein